MQYTRWIIEMSHVTTWKGIACSLHMQPLQMTFQTENRIKSQAQSRAFDWLIVLFFFYYTFISNNLFKCDCFFFFHFSRQQLKQKFMQICILHIRYVFTPFLYIGKWLLSCARHDFTWHGLTLIFAREHTWRMCNAECDSEGFMNHMQFIGIIKLGVSFSIRSFFNENSSSEKKRMVGNHSMKSPFLLAFLLISDIKYK